MARSKRGNVLRRHDQIINLLETALGYLGWLYNKAMPHHPDYAEGYANIMMMVQQAKEFTEKMRTFI